MQHGCLQHLGIEELKRLTSHYLRLIFGMRDLCLVLVQSQNVFDQNHGLNLQQSVMATYYLGLREVHTCTLEKSCVSLPFAQESSDMGQTYKNFFVLKYLSFSCLRNSFLPSVPLEQGKGPLLC